MLRLDRNWFMASKPCPSKQIDSLAEAIADCPRAISLPEKPVTEIWPLVPVRTSLFFVHLNHESPVTGYGAAGIRLSAATDVRLQGSGVVSDGIVRALPYCHGLLIEDPLGHAAEMHLGSAREVRDVSRLAHAGRAWIRPPSERDR